MDRTPRDAWKNAWNAPAGFRELFHWYREREDVENAERVEDSSYRDPQLEATRTAIESVLPGYKRPRIRRTRGAALVISKDGQDLAFDQLSGGERVLVALAGDIARRLAIANPESESPLEGEGVDANRYLANGRLAHPDQRIQQDIDDRLNLNVGFLVEGRLAAREELITRLKHELGPDKTWTADRLQRYLDERRKSTRLLAYFGDLESLLARWIAKRTN